MSSSINFKCTNHFWVERNLFYLNEPPGPKDLNTHKVTCRDGVKTN